MAALFWLVCAMASMAIAAIGLLSALTGPNGKPWGLPLFSLGTVLMLNCFVMLLLSLA